MEITKIGTVIVGKVNWNDLAYLSYYQSNVNFANLRRFSVAMSTLVWLYQNRYYVPKWYQFDREFVEKGRLNCLVSLLEIWIVECFG